MALTLADPQEMFPRERDMRPIVMAWVQCQGLLPVFETSLSHLIDIMGVRFRPRVSREMPELDRLVAVELKLFDIAGVLHQCVKNKHFVNASWAAMPATSIAKMRRQTLEKFTAAGVGLLSVAADVEVVVQAAEQPLPTFPRMQSLRRRFWRYLRKDIIAKAIAVTPAAQ